MMTDPELADIAIQHGMTARTAKVARAVLLILVINYFISLASATLGISIISAETLQNVPFMPIRRELATMEYSSYYGQFADAYAGFMIVILLLFVLSTTLLLVVFLRRVSVILRLINNPGLESLSWFIAVLILYSMGSFYWAVEPNSVFFNANSKIGGNYYWFSTLLISIIWMGVAPMSIFLTFTPRFFSHSIFEDHPALKK